MPHFRQWTSDHFDAARSELHALFKTVAPSIAAHGAMDIKKERKNEIGRSEFNKIQWDQLTKILGADNLEERFASTDLDTVWMALDTNDASTVTPEEFLAECRGEPYCSWTEALEAYEILRDQHDELPVKDLGNALRAIGMNPTEQQVMDLANRYDTNADGVLDRDEWKSIVDDMMKFPRVNRDNLQRAFEKVAKGQRKGADAEITTEELVFVSTKLGHGLDEREVAAMVHAVDANHDGNVTFDEFVQMVQKLPAYAEGETA